MIQKERIEELTLQRIAELNKGLFIVEISISNNNAIKVELDIEQGNVSIEDCVSVSRNIEHNLDREELDFELQVSSAGLDKALRKPQQFVKNIGREVRIVLKENNEIIQGTLIDVNGESIKVKTLVKEKEKKKKIEVVRECELKYNEIKETKIVISFKK